MYVVRFQIVLLLIQKNYIAAPQSRTMSHDRVKVFRMVGLFSAVRVGVSVVH